MKNKKNSVRSVTPWEYLNNGTLNVRSIVASDVAGRLSLR